MSPLSAARCHGGTSLGFYVPLCCLSGALLGAAPRTSVSVACHTVSSLGTSVNIAAFPSRMALVKTSVDSCRGGHVRIHPGQVRLISFAIKLRDMRAPPHSRKIAPRCGWSFQAYLSFRRGHGSPVASPSLWGCPPEAWFAPSRCLSRCLYSSLRDEQSRFHVLPRLMHFWCDINTRKAAMLSHPAVRMWPLMMI
jgi:hypothetical protein